MQRVDCAWCGNWIRGSLEWQEPISHGICKKCLAAQMSALEKLCKEKGESENKLAGTD